MPLDPSIILGGRPAPIAPPPSPLETAQTLASIENVRAQADARRLAADKARQDANDRAAVQQAFQEAGDDVPKALSLLRARGNGVIAGTIEKTWQENVEKAAQSKKLDLEVKALQLNHNRQLAAMVTDQDSWDRWIPTVQKQDPDMATALGAVYDPKKLENFNTALMTADQVNQAHLAATKYWLGDKPMESLNAALAAGDPTLPTAKETWDQTIRTYRNMGMNPELIAQAGEFSPENHARATRAALGVQKPVAVQTTDAQGNPITQYVVPKAGDTYAKPDEHSPAYKEWQDYVKQGGKLDFNAYMNMDANRKAVRVNAGQGSADDIKDAVQGMIDGRVPPMLPGRASAAYTAMLAEAQRRHYDLAGAATDWMATQAHIKTMNSGQQLGLNQSINALPGLLDSVDALATEWKGTGAPFLNRANLVLAKNGAYGQKAASVANRLQTQINETISDLAKVYMGSNSPTDHALQLAATTLKSDWSEQVLHDLVAQARENVRIRRNSINSTGVAGASADNPYMPAPPPAAADTTTTPNPFRK